MRIRTVECMDWFAADPPAPLVRASTREPLLCDSSGPPNMSLVVGRWLV